MHIAARDGHTKTAIMLIRYGASRHAINKVYYNVVFINITLTVSMCRSPIFSHAYIGSNYIYNYYIVFLCASCIVSLGGSWIL